MNASNIAVFIDVENLTRWVKFRGPDHLIDALNKKGSTLVRKAYGDWSHGSIRSLQPKLNQLGFDLIHTFHPISGKNSADIQFTMDVIECVLRKPEIDCYVLATGDADFSPLFRRLRDLGKEVIGVGPKSPLSQQVEPSCSSYIYTDSHTQAIRKTGSGYNRAAALARNTLRNLNGYAESQELKKRMLEADPQFDEQHHGFASFQQFLEYIPTIHLTPINGSEDVVAYIDPKTPTSLDSTNTENQTLAEASPVLLENKEGTLQMYQRFLESQQWHAVSKQPLTMVYHALTRFKAMPKHTMEAELSKRLRGEINSSTVRHCITLFLKSGLFSLSLRGDSPSPDNKLLSLERRTNYLSEIDFSMLSRLLAAIEENQQVIDCQAIRELLYGRYSDRQLEQLISDASTKLTLLNN